MDCLEILETLDEHKQAIPESLYINLCDVLKRVYNADEREDDDDDDDLGSRNMILSDLISIYRDEIESQSRHLDLAYMKINNQRRALYQLNSRIQELYKILNHLVKDVSISSSENS